jgi:hypothetical protein
MTILTFLSTIGLDISRMNVFGEAIVDIVPANQMISERVVVKKYVSFFFLLISPHFSLPPHFSAPSLHFYNPPSSDFVGPFEITRERRSVLTGRYGKVSTFPCSPV